MFAITSQGHPYARFKRALQSRNATLATAAAQELEEVALDDALRLVLLYRDARDWRYERAALRWHLLLLTEAPALGLQGARVSAQALIAIGGRHVERGVEALSELLERARARRALAALDEWIELLSLR